MIEWSYIIFDATIVSAVENCIIYVLLGSRGHARIEDLDFIFFK